MGVKYTNIFHCNTLQNLPKLEFLVGKHAIWQPWYKSHPFGIDVSVRISSSGEAARNVDEQLVAEFDLVRFQLKRHFCSNFSKHRFR
jgi:hypothetical protein